MNAYKENVIVFKAMSDETRLKIIDMLSCGEMCACDILQKLCISQSTLSYHMNILTGSGLVKGFRDGVWVKYTLNLKKTKEVIGFVNNITSYKEKCICKD